MDRETWWDTVNRVTKRWTQLKHLSTHSTHAHFHHLMEMQEAKIPQRVAESHVTRHSGEGSSESIGFQSYKRKSRTSKDVFPIGRTRKGITEYHAVLILASKSFKQDFKVYLL